MKEIQLSKQGKYKSLNLVALVDDEDFDYLNQWRWYANKDRDTFYARRSKAPRITMHRLILGLSDPNIIGDHKDHDGLNNQRYNLRIATRSQNGANRKVNKNASSKYLGVSWDRGNNSWTVQIKKNGRFKYKKGFKSETDAALAYNKKALELHGEFANLNIIENTTNIFSEAS